MATVSQMLALRAQETPAAEAVVTEDTRWTWRDLSDLSLRLSARLRAEGVQPGDRVVLLCPNIAGYLAAWYAIANAGAIAVTVNTGLKGEPLRHSVRNTDPALLLIEDSLWRGMEEDLTPVLKGMKVLRFEGDDGLAALAVGQEPDAPFEGPEQTPLSVVFTSGTTGLPKGVLNCHGAYLESGRRLADALEVTAQDRVLVVLPLFHANPQVYAMMTALQTGCCVIVRPKFSASGLFDDARRFKATMFTYVGTILAMIAAKHPQSQRDHGLTRCVGGGCPREVWTRMQEDFGITPHELYGMSETAGWVAANTTTDYRFGSCGQVRGDVELAVVDANDHPVSTGEAGEIVMRPREPFRILLEYWGNPRATQAASRNFWFHTGDVGRFDKDGYLFFEGRTKEIIRKGGENISPTELEAQIIGFDKVTDAAVVAVPDPILGDEIKACIVAPNSFDPQELRSFLEPRVAKFMLPRYVQFLDGIPRTETEKIKRNLLQDNDTGVIDLMK